MSHMESQKAKPQKVVDVLSNFMRVNYGTAAVAEARRHVVAYSENAQHELADIWMCVAEALKETETLGGVDNGQVRRSS